MFNNEVYFEALKALNEKVGSKEAEYTNKVIASAIAQGKKEKLTEDWLRVHLIGNYEDGLISYDTALALNETYKPVIEEMKQKF